MASVFTKIIKGELKGSFVYNDSLCSVFMDIHPFSEGHVLVVPKVEIARFADLPSGIAAHLFRVAHMVVQAMNNMELSPDGYNLFLSDGIVAGQDVPHAHLHVVPRMKGDGLHVSFGSENIQCSRIVLNKIARSIAKEIEKNGIPNHP